MSSMKLEQANAPSRLQVNGSLLSVLLHLIATCERHIWLHIFLSVFEKRQV